MVMATRVAESWLKDFLPTSAVPNTAATVLDKMCTHSGNVQDCEVETLRGTKISWLIQMAKRQLRQRRQES